MFENTSDIELADLHFSILRNFSFTDVESMLDSFTNLFAKKNPQANSAKSGNAFSYSFSRCFRATSILASMNDEFSPVSVECFLKVVYSAAVRFSMILSLLRLVKTIILSFSSKILFSCSTTS